MAYLALLVLPMHAHLLHSDEFAHVENHQTISIHLGSDLTEHDGHEGTSVLSTTSDTLVKKIDSNPLLLAILLALFLFVNFNKLSQKFLNLASLCFRKSHTYHSPPLRAPPIL